MKTFEKIFLLILLSPSALLAQIPQQLLQRYPAPINLHTQDSESKHRKNVRNENESGAWRIGRGPGREAQRYRVGRNLVMSQGNDQWDARFAPPGLNGQVTALATSGTDLYVGGWFTTAGTVPARHIARWDGSHWSTLGEGIDWDVYAIAVSGTDVYVGGSFLMAGGVSAQNIAKWDGTHWSALGSGVDEDVLAISVIGQNVYAGGFFHTAGGVSVEHIACWDGTAWHDMGGGTNYGVRALVAMGDYLYVGGDFTQVGQIAAGHIARWDGAEWAGGIGMDGDVFALAVIGSTLYAGGGFSRAGYGPANCVAKWHDDYWTGLGSGMNIDVTGLAANGNDLYAVGYFTTAGGDSAKHVARWDGSNWSALGGGIDDAYPNMWAVVVSGTYIYVGGDFTTAGGVEVTNVACWDGSVWSCLRADGEGLNGGVYALAGDGANVYAAGYFTKAGSLPANGVAKWDGNAWSALGSGVRGNVFAVAVHGDHLFIGGEFDTAGGIPAKNIAKWDGTAWNPLGSGVNGIVYALALTGDSLFAGGEFTRAGDVDVQYIARWDPTGWHALGNGTDEPVTALATDRDTLYAGGYFRTAGGVAANCIARWDGAAWSPLGSGISGDYTFIWPYVGAIAIQGGDIYAGGLFSVAGGTEVKNIARWDGSTWSDVGGGINGSYQEYYYLPVAALAVQGRLLYAGGSFDTAGSTCIPNLAQWDGHEWTGLGSGVSGEVIAISVVGLDVYVGGYIYWAGGKSCNAIAHWTPLGKFSPLPGKLHFGYVEPGQSVRDSILVKNDGVGMLNIDSIFTDTPFLTVAPHHGSLFPGDALWVDVIFCPISNDHLSGHIVFVHASIGTPDTIAVDNTIEASVDAGWNMVSVPVQGIDGRRDHLFPSAVSEAFAYFGHYNTEDTLSKGFGYWLKFNRAQTIGFAGCSFGRDTLDVRKGWNMIGSISTPIPTSTITSIPGGMITSPFYHYSSNLYEPSPIINPGVAYWVNVSQSGKLVLATGAGSIQNRIVVAGSTELPPPPPGEEMPGTEKVIPAEYALAQAYPNPFNPSTTIKYQLSQDSRVSLLVYNTLGQVVAVLADGIQQAGYKQVEWNANNVPSGVYFYRLVAGDFSQVRKMLLIR